MWRRLGWEQTSMFRPGTTEPVEIDTTPARPPPAQRHSRTSLLAAQQIEHRATTLRALIYRHLLARLPDGATDEEGQRDLVIGGSTYRPRRVELQELGLVRDGGATRRTLSRREAVVWVAVPLEEP